MKNEIKGDDHVGFDGVTGKPDERKQVLMTCNDEFPCVELRDVCDICNPTEEKYHKLNVDIAVSDDTRNEITSQLVKLITIFKAKQ